MIAVLPFANLSDDPSQDYFSDGLTEEMVTELGRVNPSRLGVIARTSVMGYKRSTAGVRQIGRDLGVDYLVEGGVQRSGDQVRITAQLIRVSDQTHLWAEAFNRPARDIPGVQQSVAQAVSEKIRLQFGPLQQPQPDASHTPNPEAHDAYLQGRYYWNRRDNASLKTAVQRFVQAIERDPGYALAYSGLADSYTLLGLDGMPPADMKAMAEGAAEQGVKLDPSSAEAHTSLAATLALCDWDWPGAEREFHRALELDPNYATAHQWYADLYLLPLGKSDAAVAELKVALRLDPLSPIMNTDLGYAYYATHRYDEALAQYEKALELDPRFVPVHFRLSQFYGVRREYDRAVTESAVEIGLTGTPDQRVGLERIYNSGGYRKVLEENVRHYEADLLASHRPVGMIAIDYLALGAPERALQALEQAYHARDPGMIYLKVEPGLDPLRSQARFQELERGMGLLP